MRLSWNLLSLIIVSARCAQVWSLTSFRAIGSQSRNVTASSGASGIQRSAALLSAGISGSHGFGQETSSTKSSWSLRLCNAYAYDGWVNVFHGFGRRPGTSYTTSSGDGETQLTAASGPLPFKRCIDVNEVALRIGSVLKFRISGDMQIGTFWVEALPQPGSMLQLVLKRRDTWSTAADFSSHVFANTPDPQVALVNAYLGPARSMPEVRDMPTGFHRLQEGPHRVEEVALDTVVDIAPGHYEWRLLDAKGSRKHAEKASLEFEAVERSTYTIIRVGTEAIGGQSYAEELVVWPADGAVVHRGYAGNDNKGLFGIPKDLGSSRRSQASRQRRVFLVVTLAFALTAAQYGQA